jgi:predicted enzyme related to lactoylglutathione lyase
MIDAVRSVGIYARDQERAKQFWTETMGFALLQDAPFGEGERWIEIQPPRDDLILVLYTPKEQQHLVGTFSNVLFTCDDIQQTYEQLSARGVEFPDPPRKEFWGWWAMFKDPDGNSYGLGQRGE